MRICVLGVGATDSLLVQLLTRQGHHISCRDRDPERAHRFLGAASAAPNQMTPPPTSHPRDPLHGITLETIIKELVAKHGWEEMGKRVPIRCFLHDPSVKSSLTFLRKTPWARERVEGWYIAYKDL